MRLILFLALILPTWAQEQTTINQARSYGKARENGPVIHDVSRGAGVSAYQVLTQMFQAIEEKWFVPAYEQAKQVEIRARLDADLPPPKSVAKLDNVSSMRIEADVTMLTTPGGKYHTKVTGDFGAVTMIGNPVREMVMSEDFRAFSDTPQRTRGKGANLSSFRGYLLHKIAPMRSTMLDSGSYRYAYDGTGNYQGQIVHIIRVYKPSGKRVVNRRAPVSFDRFWTFWKDGGYEIWIFKNSNLPAAAFYTNTDDNIYSNFTIDYDRNQRPSRISLQNNSVGAEGSGEIIFTYDAQGMVSGTRLSFNSNEGINLNFDASLAYDERETPERYRMIPPFGSKKMNKDVLNLMILTQVSGNLLKLKQYGLSIKNFKFR